VLGGWPAALVGYPAAVSVPVAFLAMIVASKLTASRAPHDVARIFARMHVPERLGMGVERLPSGTRNERD
jgi:Na+(H+)/acetate symporter ActP